MGWVLTPSTHSHKALVRSGRVRTTDGVEPEGAGWAFDQFVVAARGAPGRGPRPGASSDEGRVIQEAKTRR